MALLCAIITPNQGNDRNDPLEQKTTGLMSELIHLAAYRANSGGRKPANRPPVFFSRAELSQLLAVYSEFVAAGHWRDYAIDHLPEGAFFSIYRHAHEAPVFAIVKVPEMKKRPAGYTLFRGNKKMLRSTRLIETIEYLRAHPRLVFERV